MSARERNLERLRHGLGAFSRGAFEEAMAYVDPQIEWHVTFRLPDLPLAKERVVFYGYRMRDGRLAYSRAFEDEASARCDLGLGNAN